MVSEPAALVSYEGDGYMARARPLAVCLPTTTGQVSDAIRLARQYGFPVTPRGAGTGLSGGATPIHGGLVIATSRMHRIREIDAENMRAIVEPGLVNVDLTRAAEPFGLYFAPDPSSQTASTIGGNVAENAGGPHCLAYGVTTNHVLGMEAVLIDGTIVSCGTMASSPDAPGYDFPGILTGSEGTLAFVTAVCVRLMPRAETVRTVLALFDTFNDAGAATSAIIEAGIIPAALEMMDAQLADNRFIAGPDFTVADITALLPFQILALVDIKLPGHCRSVARWHEEVSARPSVVSVIGRPG